MTNFGPYSIPCQRCGKRAAVQRKLGNTREAWLFCAATNRLADEVQLCGGCIKTVKSLGESIARAKARH